MSKKILFFGNERLATGVSTTAPTLRALIQSDYEVVAVIANYSQGPSRQARELEIVEVAKAHDIPVFLPKKLNEIKSQLESFDVELAVLVAYGKMVPSWLIDLFPKGIINIHPSLLPLHRGPSPIESTILNNELKTGLTIMRLAPKMDSGPIYAQVEIELAGDETKQALADQLGEIGSQLLLEVLPGIFDGSIQPIEQDESRATYDRLIEKADGKLNFRKPAEQLAREIRAYAGWPGSYTSFGGLDVTVTEAHSVPSTPIDASTGKPTSPGRLDIIPEAKTLMIITSDGALCIDSLKPAGKREMSVSEFLAGYGSRLQP